MTENSKAPDFVWEIAPGTPITEVLNTDGLNIKNQATQDDQPIGPEPASPTDAHPHKGSDAPRRQ